jgi:cytoskeletal protein RodZ
MPTFGEDLRRERELRQISLREVAEATKVNIRYLEALERNDFSHLPGGLFNRGFVRAYCQFIGIDVDTMVNAYILEERAQCGSTEEPSTPWMRGTGSSTVKARVSSREPARSRRSRTLGWFLLVLALAIVTCALLLLRGSFFRSEVLAPRPDRERLQGAAAESRQGPLTSRDADLARRRV